MGSWAVLLLGIVVSGGIYGGVFTVAEAAAVGAIMAFGFTVMRGRLTRRVLWRVLSESLLVIYYPKWSGVLRKGPAQPPDSPQIEESGPNWTMPELVQHMQSMGLTVVQCMGEIEDKARLGQLDFWGRKYSAAFPHENPNPMKPIETVHWDHYCLDAARCAYAEDASTCCTVNEKYKELEGA